MNRLRSLAALLFVTAILAGCTASGTVTPAEGGSPASAATKITSRPTAQIYMFRGGFNGIFSTGITEMAAELRRRGVPAQDLSWAASGSSLAKIRKAVADNPKTGPIILAGHSLGAGSVLTMAESLGQSGITVDLIILFDPLSSAKVPGNVRKLVNFKASGNKNNPGGFKPGAGFNGKIVDVDIRNLPDLDSASHWNIVNQQALQKRVIREIETTYRRWRR